jgi:hypothetical protein
MQTSTGFPLTIRTVRTGSAVPFNLPAEITSAYLSDLAGNPRSGSVTVGALAYFTMNVANKNSGVLQMNISISLFDSNAVPIAQMNVPCSLPSFGASPEVLGVPIPTSAHSGVAYGYADVYTSLPKDGGYPISLEKAFTFTITGGVLGSGDAPTTSGSTGDYSLTFRLPKDNSVDGTNTIYASVSHGGETQKASTTSTYRRFQ